MTLPNQDAFVRVVRALDSYLDDLVIAGAWCHRLLRFHPLATPPTFPPLMTEDADVAVPERLRTRATSIDAALTAGGFRARLSGDDVLPVMSYHSDDDADGLYVEFIAPLRGSAYTRKGQRDDLLPIAGVTAQKLRYVELLLFQPWRLELSAARGFASGADGLTVRVASPASYLAQKVLTIAKRKPTKRAKDALYIHDTLAMFGDALADLVDEGAAVLDQLPGKTRAQFHELRVAIFEDVDLLVRAHAIAASTGRASPPSATTIAAVCTIGLERLFAPPAPMQVADGKRGR